MAAFTVPSPLLVFPNRRKDLLDGAERVIEAEAAGRWPVCLAMRASWLMLLPMRRRRWDARSAPPQMSDAGHEQANVRNGQ